MQGACCLVLHAAVVPFHSVAVAIMKGVSLYAVLRSPKGAAYVAEEEEEDPVPPTGGAGHNTWSTR